jgi:DNA segregation ATPase FtsK/SpoIIIE-like protein
MRRIGRPNLVGTFYHGARPATFVVVDELLAKNFTMVGATRSGKSRAVTLILSAILEDQMHK